MNWFNQNFWRNEGCSSYIDTKDNSKSLTIKYDLKVKELSKNNKKWMLVKL